MSDMGTQQKRFGSDDSDSVPPHIDTLNMTRASFTMNGFPQPPLPVHSDTLILQRPETVDTDDDVPVVREMNSLDLENQTRTGGYSGRRNRGGLGAQTESTTRGRIESY